VFLLNEAVEDEVWKRLKEKILPILEDRQGRVLGGVSEPAVRGRAANHWRNRRRTSMPHLSRFGRLLGHYYGVSRSRPCDVMTLPNTQPHHDHSNDEPTEDTRGNQCF
jgi:hypothetical protein